MSAESCRTTAPQTLQKPQDCCEPEWLAQEEHLLVQDPNTGDLFTISSSFRVEVLVQRSSQSLFTGLWRISGKGEPHGMTGQGTMGGDQGIGQ